MGEMRGNSLRELDSLPDRMKLARQADKRAAVIVEGTKDRRLLRRVCPEMDLAVYIAGSRDKALSDCASAVGLGLQRLACLVDRDFDDEIAGAQAGGLPVVAYDNADAESMLWHTETLSDVLDEVASAQKLESFGGAAALRERAEQVLRPVSNLRRANALHGWGLDFKSLRLEGKIDKVRLEVSVQAICDALWDGNLDLAKVELYEAAVDGSYAATCPETGLALVRGRDALAVASAALRRLVGSLGLHEAAVAALEQRLRLAASPSLVSATHWRPRLEALVA